LIDKTSIDRFAPDRLTAWAARPRGSVDDREAEIDTELLGRTLREFRNS